ncbi:uncharacterized protein TNCV_1687971 [Trichonephila clavipes]|nr:uncharacterized protein TNCV_1687971 [Trichonephila clavipes]
MKVERMTTRRKRYTNEFLLESQKLLEREPTSKDAGLTLLAEGLSNIGKYPGHLLDIVCYDGNPRNKSLVGVDGTCVNKTLHMVPEEEVYAGEIRRTHRPIYRITPSNPSLWICCVSNALRTSTVKCEGTLPCWNHIRVFILAGTLGCSRTGSTSCWNTKCIPPSRCLDRRYGPIK